MRIFLADDDDDDCLLFKDAILEIDENIDLIVSKNGDELMKTFKVDVPPLPDVLFLDLNMPCKTGFECLNEIKRTEALKDVPVVVLSTSSNPENIRKAYDCGADFYARKPGDFYVLKKLIEQILCIDWNIDMPRDFKDFLLLSKD
jgi:CheY-like chemotaxis protein